MRNVILFCICLILIQPIGTMGFGFDKTDRVSMPADTLPAPPAYLRCGDGKQGYGLYWVDNSTNEIKFKVYRAVNGAANYTELTEIKSKTAVTKGTEYFCKIDYVPENSYVYVATSMNHMGESNPSDPAIIPKRPVDLSGKADSISVTLDWIYPTDSWIQLIFIERSKNADSGFNIMAPVVSQNGVKFIDYSIERGVDYYYRIRGAFYQSKTRVTSYSKSTEAIGPFKIPVIGKNYDGEISYEGQNYKFKTFENQTWMIENLAYLPEVCASNSISVEGKRYYVYGYQGSDVSEAKKTANYKLYGVLYNWTAASNGVIINPMDPIGVQGICPAGWHLPSNKEWSELDSIMNKMRAVKDSSIRADAREKGIKGIQNIQFEGDFAMPDFNEFVRKQGGYLQGDSGNFFAIGKTGNYWSSTSRILTDRGFNFTEADKGFGFSVRCLKGAALPSVLTENITALTETTATSGSNITHDGGASITAWGVCWNTLESPTIINHTNHSESDSGVFSCSITGLTAGTLYFLRAYATNSAGTAYGEQKQFITNGDGALPSVTTGEITEITGASAAVHCNLTAYGGAPVTSRGVCWSTKRKPTVSNNKVTDQSGKPAFIGYIPELKALTQYYVRAYATNSYGTFYGEEKQFTTSEKSEDGTFNYQDRAYTYKTIGTQTWMTKNLAYLPSVSPSSDGSKEKSFYYVYGYEGTIVDEAKANSFYNKYGVLYNWMAAKTSCPEGWHLPSDKEISVLTDYLTNYGYGFGGSGNDIAKSMATTSGWDSLPIPGSVGYDQVSNNRSGFDAVPAGQRTVPRNGMTSNYHKATTFWTTSEFKQETSSAYALVLFYSHDIVHPYPNADKRNGYSVRCLKDK